MPSPVLLSWSGGKDSALSLHALQQRSDVEVVGLLTAVTRDYDRVSVHGVRRALLAEQARAVGLPLHEIMIDANCANEAYERAFLEALGSFARDYPGVSSVAFGDLFLDDVRAYRERLLEGSGFSTLFPIWGEDTTLLARRFIGQGFVARLVCVDTVQLDPSFAGRIFDEDLLAELPPETDLCGERGEFHTFVSDGPIFSRPIPYQVGSPILRDGRFMFCDLA